MEAHLNEKDQDQAHRVDGKYAIGDLVDIVQLRELFEQFTKATGFTIGFLDHPGLNILIASGWRDICTRFHRGCPASASNCEQSNRHLLNQLDEPGQVVIEACDNGLVDCATPIIIKGKHIASLATGQLFLKTPDLERFRRQARLFGFDEAEYLREVQGIPVVTEDRLKAMTTFLGQMALVISQVGYAKLTAQGESERLDKEIGERMRAEEAVRTKTDELNRFFDTTLDLLCIANTDGRFIRLNRQWEKSLGYSLQELMAYRFLDLVHPDDVEATRQTLASLAKQKEFQNFVNRYRHRDGSYRWIEWRSVPVGSLIYTAAHDITEKKAMEDRLYQVEKLTAIGQLAGGVAHDFNNQLTGIMGYAEMLVNLLDKDDLKGYAQGILDSARRAADLTHKLLSFGRKGKLLTLPVDVHHLLGEMESILTRSIDKRIRIGQVLKATSPVILGDPTQLQNVLLNLALNARDAMPGGGELTFETETILLNENDCRNSLIEIKPGPYLCITIRDTGCGMAPEVRKHLFEPFFTTKKPGEGTGMGLASVYGAMQNHHGTIRIYSEVDRGTTVRLYLPIPRNAGAVERPAPISVPVSGSGRILLVDDESLIRDVGAVILRQLGYSVATCSDGREATEYYREHWRDIDLAILDMVMPDMSGRDALAAMRRINPEIRAILSSGYSLDRETPGTPDEGILDFIGKPYQQAELSHKVAQALRANSTPKGA